MSGAYKLLPLDNSGGRHATFHVKGEWLNAMVQGHKLFEKRGELYADIKPVMEQVEKLQDSTHIAVQHDYDLEQGGLCKYKGKEHLILESGKSKMLIAPCSKPNAQVSVARGSLTHFRSKVYFKCVKSGSKYELEYDRGYYAQNGNVVSGPQAPKLALTKAKKVLAALTNTKTPKKERTKAAKDLYSWKERPVPKSTTLMLGFSGLATTFEADLSAAVRFDNRDAAITYINDKANRSRLFTDDAVFVKFKNFLKDEETRKISKHPMKIDGCPSSDRIVFLEYDLSGMKNQRSLANDVHLFSSGVGPQAVKTIADRCKLWFSDMKEKKNEGYLSKQNVAQTLFFVKVDTPLTWQARINLLTAPQKEILTEFARFVSPGGAHYILEKCVGPALNGTALSSTVKAQGWFKALQNTARPPVKKNLAAPEHLVDKSGSLSSVVSQKEQPKPLVKKVLAAPKSGSLSSAAAKKEEPKLPDNKNPAAPVSPVDKSGSLSSAVAPKRAITDKTEPPKKSLKIVDPSSCSTAETFEAGVVEEDSIENAGFIAPKAIPNFTAEELAEWLSKKGGVDHEIAEAILAYRALVLRKPVSALDGNALVNAADELFNRIVAAYDTDLAKAFELENDYGSKATWPSVFGEDTAAYSARTPFASFACRRLLSGLGAAHKMDDGTFDLTLKPRSTNLKF